jgi:hypothetical protein
MTRSEIARRKRQMNRRIRELVAIRRATMSFAAAASVRVPTAAPTTTATTTRPVQPAVTTGPVAIRERVTARASPFPQIAPPRQVKPSPTRSPLNAARPTMPPVCP